MKALSSFFQKFYIILMFVILYLPIAVMIAMSFNGSRSAYMWSGLSLMKYRMLFENGEIMEAVINTMTVAVGTATIASLIGTAACVGLMAVSRRLRNAAVTAVNIPLLNADIVTGVALMLFFAKSFGRLSFGTLLISHVSITLPYVMLNVMPKLQHLDNSAYNAALDLGASPAYAFRRVVLPELLPDIITGFLFAFTISFDDFTLTYYTAGAGISTISTSIYTNRTRGILPEYYALFALMFVLALGVLFFVSRRSLKSGEVATGYIA